MGLENEPWKIDNEAKVAKIARAMGQDVGRNFRDNILRKLFPEKKIFDEKLEKQVDIGLICCDWMYQLLTIFEPSDKKIESMIFFLINAYDKGFNIESDNSFRKYVAFFIAPSFSKKINKFSQIAKLSLMDNLDRSYKPKKVNKGDDIQW